MPPLKEYGVVTGENCNGVFVVEHFSILFAEFSNDGEVVLEGEHDMSVPCYQLG